MVRRDSFTVRAGSESKKEDFKKRCKNLKNSKGCTQADIFEAGLMALEGGTDEQSIIYRKQKAISKRDNAIAEVNSLNKLIEAYNRQLKNKNKTRYSELDVAVSGIREIYDSEGNLIC